MRSLWRGSSGQGNQSKEGNQRETRMRHGLTWERSTAARTWLNNLNNSDAFYSQHHHLSCESIE
jgi:hypothetical protein